VTEYSVVSAPAGGHCTVAGTGAVCSGLDPGRSYTFDVAAINAAGRSVAVTSAAVSTAAVGCVAIAATPFASWRADASDATSAVPLVGTAGQATGVIGDAFNLSGAESMKSPGAGAIGQSVTVELWVKPAGPITRSQVLVSRWDFAHESTRAFALSLDPSNVIRWEIDDLGAIYPETLRAIAPSLTDGAFHHLAAVWSGRQMSIYLDGVVVARRTTVISSLSQALDVPIEIGQWAGIGDPLFFRGVIDEPTIWADGLTPAEIEGIATAGGAGRCG
jgi:hypothetical protein